MKKYSNVSNSHTHQFARIGDSKKPSPISTAPSTIFYSHYLHFYFTNCSYLPKKFPPSHSLKNKCVWNTKYWSSSQNDCSVVPKKSFFSWLPLLSRATKLIVKPSQMSFYFPGFLLLCLWQQRRWINYTYLYINKPIYIFFLIVYLFIITLRTITMHHCHRISCQLFLPCFAM